MHTNFKFSFKFHMTFKERSIVKPRRKINIYIKGRYSSYLKITFLQRNIFNRLEIQREGDKHHYLLEEKKTLSLVFE